MAIVVFKLLKNIIITFIAAILAAIAISNHSSSLSVRAGSQNILPRQGVIILEGISLYGPLRDGHGLITYLIPYI